MTTQLNIKARVQSIYYQTDQDELIITHATSDKRISLVEAAQILADRNTSYKQILQVKYEILDLAIPLENIDNYVVTKS